MDGGAWWATVHRVAKSRTRLSDFVSLHLLLFTKPLCVRAKSAAAAAAAAKSLQSCSTLCDPLDGSPPSSLEKAMAPHSSTLAWKIPRMEEPGRPQSMGSLRVGHD